MNIIKLDEFLDILFSDYEKEGAGFCVGVINGGKLIFSKNRGYANIINKEKCFEKTNFRLASVTKQFTATCILQLVDKGKVHLEDDIKKYFPQFIHTKNVTVYNLLTHTSGLLDYEDLLRNTRKNPISDKDVLQLLSRQRKVKFESGSSRDYNNGAYCILKELIEKISGLSFGKYLKQNIFIPLNMNNTILSERGKTHISNRALGYSFSDSNTFVETDNDITSFTMGDGSIYSNIEDLSKWILGRKSLISSNFLTLSQQKLFLTREKNNYYGFGLNINEINGYKSVYHGGYSIGFRTSIYMVPEKDFGVIFLSNLHKNEGNDFTQKIAEFLINDLL